MRISQIVRILLLVLLLSSNSSVLAFQQGKSIELSARELSRANKKLQKQLNKLEKQYTKHWKEQYPDLSKEQLDSSIREEVRLKKEAIKTEAKDSVTSYLNSLKTELANDLKATPEKLPVAAELKETIAQIESLEIIQAFSAEGALSEDKVRQLIQKRADNLQAALTRYKREFADWDHKLLDRVISLPEAQLVKEKLAMANSFKPLPDELMADMPKLQNNDLVKEKLEAKADELKEKGLASLQEKLDQAQTKLNDVKEQFPSLKSIEHGPEQEDAPQDKSFLKRLILGGNLQISHQSPLSINAALRLTYPVSEKFSFGTALASQIPLSRSENGLRPQSLLGIRSFMRYQVWQHFYIQGNYEFTRETKSAASDSVNQHWLRTALLGIGKEVQISRGIKVNMTLFHDFFYQPHLSPHNSPWVFRLGFDLVKRN